MKNDLVGQEFFWRYNWGGGGNQWAVRAGEVQDMVIDKRFTDSAAGTEEIHVLTTLFNGATKVRGMLVFQYKKYDQGWSFRSVEPRDGGPGKSFSFEILPIQ